MFAYVCLVHAAPVGNNDDFLQNTAFEAAPPTLPSPSPIHSRNIVIEAAASNPEFTVLHGAFIL